MAKNYPDFSTLIEYFYHWESTTPDVVFLRQPQGDKWINLTFAEAGQQARKMATALHSFKIKKGDHVAIFSKNCYHWVLADLAIQMAGCVSVPLYPSLPKEKLQDVILKSDAKLIFVGKLDEWGDKYEAIPEGIEIIRFPQYPANAKVTQGTPWDELLNKHDAKADNEIPDPESLWTILFTSGTTGSPKGVMHLHKTPALIMQSEKKTSWLGIHQAEQQKYFSFLPLNHVAERLGMETPAICTGGSISFAESLETFAKNLQETQPTTFFAVPRIWTKFYLGVLQKMPQAKLDKMLKIPIVSGMVKKKLLTALGLKDATVVATGAAITPGHLKDWYKKLGIQLVEAYGMTEVCGSITNSPMADCPPDSVGKVIPGAEIKIHEETGEILMKTPFMMTGYYKDEEKTNEVLIDGWMHSGDKGTIDENGFLRVVGRVKDAFKTSKGSYITPNPMEEVFTENDYVEQICVAGLGIPQPIALVNLSEMGQAADREEVKKSLLASAEKVNAKQANYAKISTVIINKDSWSQENDLLTPTLKVKRSNLDARYGKDYLNWHEAADQIIWE